MLLMETKAGLTVQTDVGLTRYWGGLPKALPRVGRQVVSTPTPASGPKEAEVGVGWGYSKKNKIHTIPKKARARYQS